MRGGREPHCVEVDTATLGSLSRLGVLPSVTLRAPGCRLHLCATSSTLCSTSTRADASVPVESNSRERVAATRCDQCRGNDDGVSRGADLSQKGGGVFAEPATVMMRSAARPVQGVVDDSALIEDLRCADSPIGGHRATVAHRARIAPHAGDTARHERSRAAVTSCFAGGNRSFARNGRRSRHRTRPALRALCATGHVIAGRSTYIRWLNQFPAFDKVMRCWPQPWAMTISCGIQSCSTNCSTSACSSTSRTGHRGRPRCASS